MPNTAKIIERQFHHWNHVAATLGYEAQHTRQRLTAPPKAPCVQHPVVCISREPGTEAWAVAEGLAKALNCEVFGREIIDHIAQDLQVQRRVLDQRDEQIRSEIELMVEGMLRGRHIDNRDYFESLIRVVRGVAYRGHVVLLGRGANAILGTEATLRVRLSAPREHRIESLAKAQGLTEREAKSRVEKLESEQRHFFRHFFHVDQDDPSLNDITLNTASLPGDVCVSTLLGALRAKGIDLPTG